MGIRSIAKSVLTKEKREETRNDRATSGIWSEASCCREA